MNATSKLPDYIAAAPYFHPGHDMNDYLFRQAPKELTTNNSDNEDFLGQTD